MFEHAANGVVCWGWVVFRLGHPPLSLTKRTLGNTLLNIETRFDIVIGVADSLVNRVNLPVYESLALRH